jgi:aspartate-semialdehyde dehydrogenase
LINFAIKNMKLALIGCTGLVGREMIQVMEEFNLPVSHFYPLPQKNLLEK